MKLIAKVLIALLLGLTSVAVAHAQAIENVVYDYTGTVQTFDVTTNGGLRITAFGGAGGIGVAPGGRGAEIGGDAFLTGREFNPSRWRPWRRWLFERVSLWPGLHVG